MICTNPILARAAIRRTARFLLSPCLIEPDLNREYSVPRTVISMKQFIDRKTPVMCEDVKDDSSWYLFLLRAKGK
jgi:hypothetical protein